VTSERALKLALRAMGAVPVIMGGYAVVTGARPIPDSGHVSASVDSEMRFMSAWYVGGGLVAFRAARDPKAEPTLVRLLCAIVLLGALGRVLSIRRLGRPPRLFLFLLGVELAVPALIVPWQAAVARQAGDQMPRSGAEPA
jgi:uncharacterized membrane protein YedE/YeeE